MDIPRENGAVPRGLPSRSPQDWGWFAAWALVGAASSLGLLSLWTIGMLVLLCAAVGTALLVTHRQTDRGLPGLLSGLSLPVFYVAYLNRDGPGDVCVTTGTEQSCTEEWSPWPWLAAGIVLGLAGIVVFLVLRSRSSSRRTPA